MSTVPYQLSTDSVPLLMLSNKEYEAVIGLEVHAQLSTKSKLFCGDSTAFGAPANTQISAITLAHPGTLPKLNTLAIDYAIKLGLALNCEIEEYNYFARKNYFYPDLPKGYQVSQHTTPICKGGEVAISTSTGERKIKLNRIHIEEDAGKSIHDVDEDFTCIDHNRAGVVLLEIVSEPDMHSAEEAFAYVTELRKLVRYLGVCDGNMEEGSMRCDANVSIRLRGEETLGTKVEVKNLNSIRNIRRAIEHELERLTDKANRNETIIQETRSFDAVSGTTFSMRTKEEANDYRYFPEPDLPPFVVTDSMLQKIKASIPALPAELEKKYMSEYGLSAYDARQLCEEKETTIYFSQLISDHQNYKAAANWILGPVRSYCNEHGIELQDFPLKPSVLAKLIATTEEGQVSFSAASTKVFSALIEDTSADPLQLAADLNLLKESSEEPLQQWVDEVIQRMPDKVKEYQKGKKALIGLFAGEVKKISKGKADMLKVNEILKEKLAG